ncbi:MAG: MGMT family protein, partial [Hyphomonas sp.]|nr:MGMT family protein [Hyphomonas sp.]
IKAQVLQLTAAVPAGRVCTFQSMGEYLDVMPRHVAYLLSQLDAEEQQRVPWYRVVAADGTLGTPKQSRDRTTQAELLRAEGVAVRGNRVEPDFATVCIAAEQLPSGLARQTRPAEAPVPTSRRRPPVRRG